MKHHIPSTEQLKPHVVLVSLYQVINSKGGAEKVLCDMANALSDRDYEVSVLFYQNKQGTLGFPLNENIRLINAYTPLGFFQQTLQKLSCWYLSKEKRRQKRYRLKSIAKANSFRFVLQTLPKADVFIAFNPETTYILRDLLKIDKPLVTMYHVAPDIFRNENKFNTLFKEAVGKSDVVQVLMPEFMKTAEELHPGVRVVRIPNVAPQFRWNIDQSAKKIITVGRVCAQKRTVLLLEAFALLKDQYPDWTCECWGESGLEPKYDEIMRETIKKQGLNGRVRLCGVTDDVPSKLREASIFAFPSASEGFGIALTEAMSMGLPSVGCLDCSAVNTLIRDTVNGFLTEPTPEAYAKGLAKLMESEELRRQYGAQAREDMKIYTADSVWGAWDRLIRELIEK